MADKSIPATAATAAAVVTGNTDTTTQVNANPAPAPAPATPAATLIKVITDAKQIEAIKEHIPDRKTYATVAAAIDALNKASEATQSFYGLPLAIAGMKDDGSIDEAHYEGALATVATVGARVKLANGKAVVGIRGIVLFPIPTVETFLSAGEAGASFVAKVLEKEAALMAFRPLRDPATHEAFIRAAGDVPTTVETYLAENVRSGGGTDDTFDALWRDLRESLKVNYEALVRQLPTKGEVAKCMRSKSYAVETQPALESRGIFVRLAKMLIKGAKEAEPAPLDTTGVEAWLAGRDELNLGTGKPTADDLAALDALDF